MDLQKRMEQMRRETERRMAQMKERMEQQRERLHPCSDISVSNSTTHYVETHQLTQLIHHCGLEDETETKIGMFEQLYDSIFAKRTFTYGDTDFAPLINLLGSICEIELYASLRTVAEKAGMAFPIRSRTTFSHFIDLLSQTEAQAYLQSVITEENITEAIRRLNKIRLIRNNANHKGVVDAPRFMRFFEENYAPFFNHNIPSFIKLKHHHSNKQNDNFNLTNNDNADRICIIWTNSERLSLKYCQNVNTHSGDSVPLAILEKLIEPFIDNARQSGICYMLLDAAEYDPVSPTSIPADWRTHHKRLDIYCNTYLNDTKSAVSLFIIGGDDVIPMPRLRNPLNDDQAITSRTDLLESTIEADWVYSFQSKHIVLSAEGYLDMSQLSDRAIYRHVGRLPMEDGLMESDLTSDIGSYLNRVLDAHKDGIKINRLGTVSCQSCCMIANKMVNGLPNIDLSGFDAGHHYKDVFISPQLDLTITNDAPEAVEMTKYISYLQDCDMLMFTLHGGPQPGSPHFFGEARIPASTDMIPVFTPPILYGAKAKVVVPICCWGARFIGYRRETSALLSAIYNSDTLLYMGSCRSALGEFDTSFMDENGKLCSEPQPRYAEVLIRLFMQLLLSGIPAGEALSLAKINYLRYHAQGDLADMLTVQQFNLFGDPMLQIHPVVNPDALSYDFPSGIAASMPSITAEYLHYDNHDAFSNDSETSDSLLQRVRGFVDSNLAHIRDSINEQLYRQYNIRPSDLRRITGYKDSHGTRGFRFIYTNGMEIPATVTAFANTDGKLLQVFQSF